MTKKAKRSKQPRGGDTYRAARRNACLRGETKSVWSAACYYRFYARRR